MTDLEQLFQDAAALAEDGHPVPGDPIGRVGRARSAHRRRRLATIAVPAAAAAAAAAAAVILPSALTRDRLGDESSIASGEQPATSFTALADGRAGMYDATNGTRLRDFGPAAAVASAPDGVWVSSTSGCSSTLRFFATTSRLHVDAEMPVNALVSALAISPDGGTIAYTAATPDSGLEVGSPCGSPDLVLRDAKTGSEQRWPGAAGSGEISQLAWSADGQRLAFQTSICCDATTSVRVLDLGSAPSVVTEVPAVKTDEETCRFILPAFMDSQLVAVRQCDDAADLVRIDADGKARVIRALPTQSPVALAVDGETLLVASYGTPETAGVLTRLNPDGTEVQLGTGFTQPTWAPGATAEEPTAPPEGSLTPVASSAPTATSGPATECTYRPTTKNDAVGPDVGLPPSAPADLPGTATMHTNRGDIAISLTGNLTPCTVNSFAHLGRSKYYDETPCFRLTTQGIFVVQCGDPSGRGTGGPGYTYADENLEGRTYPAGTVAMANQGPSTNGSQFFLCYQDTTLDPNYTVFGHITTGLDVLRQVATGGSDPPADGTPKMPLQITSITLQ
jgi:peptidyl-prolyl cis-trans isomerase B (cyclophilin B)